MTSVYHEQIAAAVGAVQVHAAHRFSWMGALAPAPARVTGPFSGDMVRAQIVAALADRLYMDFYCTGHPRPADAAAGVHWDTRDDRFVHALSASNCGSGPWEPGWRVVTRFDARWLVERDGLTVAVPAGRIRIEDDGDGQQAEVQFPKELRRMTPGYYFALGDVALDPQKEPLLRIYWHLAADRAVSFLDAATRILNGDGLPFRLKILDARAAYRRCDSAILYVFQRDFERARPLVAELSRRFDGILAGHVPAFAKRLAPGVGLAEDPGGGESFGAHRCALLADGIVSAHEQGADDLRSRTAVVCATFERAGVDPGAPYLRPASTDRYELDVV